MAPVSADELRALPVMAALKDRHPGAMQLALAANGDDAAGHRLRGLLS